MRPIILLAVALSAAMCVLAFALATHALPFMLGPVAFRLARACSAGAIVAGIAAIAIAILSFRLFVCLRQGLRNPTAQLVLAIVYAAPAAVAGYALMHGGIGAAPVSEPAGQFLCLTCGAVVGGSGAAHLTEMKRPRRWPSM